MTELFDELQTIHQQKQQAAMQDGDKQRQLDSVERNRQTMLQSLQILLEYLDKQVTRTEVVNQLKSIRTPDIDKVVQAVNQLHETQKTHQNTDLSEVVTIMKGLLAEAKAIPKELAKVEIPSEVSIKNQIDHSKDFHNLQKAVEGLKLTAEAPQITVTPPEINVAAPDLAPLETVTKAVEKAVKANKAPDIIKTEQTNVLISEKFDSYKIIYNSFDDEDGRVEAIKYFNGRKLVATLAYSYNDDGNITGVKKS